MKILEVNVIGKANLGLLAEVSRQHSREAFLSQRKLLIRPAPSGSLQ